MQLLHILQEKFQFVISFIAVAKKFLSFNGRNFTSRSINRGSTASIPLTELKDKHYFEVPRRTFSVTIGVVIGGDSGDCLQLKTHCAVEGFMFFFHLKHSQ